MKFVIDDKIPFIKGVLEQHGEVLYIPGKEISPAHVNNADALITRTRTKVNEALLKDSSLKFVATATIGFDHIDRQYLASRNISWTSCPGCNSESVAQYITATLIELSLKNKKPLQCQTIGIVGVGNVGSKIKIKAEALGMKTLLCDPPRALKEGNQQFTTLDEIVEKADFITLHVPLNRSGEHKSFHLFDSTTIGKMKKSSYLFNTSRGEVINNEHLLHALQNKIIAGAVLDVWENEPLINLELLKLVTIATSHIAGYSADGKANGTSMSIQALSKFFNLNLNNWQSTNVPMPENKTLHLTQLGFAGVCEAVRTTYNIFTDDQPLRENPESFEYNRGHYQLRREFHNYSVKALDTESSEILKNLGFKIIS